MKKIWKLTSEHSFNIPNNIWLYEISKSRKIFLFWNNDFTTLMFVFSCGNNSDYSFSGSFFNTKVNEIEIAKSYLIEFSELWLNDDNKGIKELQKKYF